MVCYFLLINLSIFFFVNFNSILVEKPPSLDNWSYKARNAVLFDIDEAPLTLEEYAERENKNKKIINKKATRFDKDFSHKTKQVF